MTSIIDLADDALEEAGADLLKSLGLKCFRGRHVAMRDLAPEGRFGRGEHLEVDYLIAEDDIALLGEITARSSKRDIEKKFAKFRQHLQTLDGLDRGDSFWRRLGVPNIDLHRFRRTRRITGFFISTRADRYDVDLDVGASRIAVLYRSAFSVLETYGACIGEYAHPHFRERLGIPPASPLHVLEIGDAHGLIRLADRSIVNGSGPDADVYTFEISPYELLKIARVFRKDELPSLHPESGYYQRPLIKSKLEAIRTNVLLQKPNFVFPNSILTVLKDSTFDQERSVLRIPVQYGSLEVIDGQHRLFSYANTAVKETAVEPKILISAINFRTDDDKVVRKESARTFVEINTTQTKIEPLHLHAIQYPILGETSDQALAAAVIIRVTQSEGVLQGLVRTSKTALGKMPASTILTYTKPLTRLSRIAKLSGAQRGRPLAAKNGFERLYEIDNITELFDAEVLVEKSSVALRRYFSQVKSVFKYDFPRRSEDVDSSMQYAKVFAAFIKLFNQFIKEGLEWREVTEQLQRIKTSLKELRDVRSYRSPLFVPEDESIPDDKPSVNDDFKFLQANRKEKTSVQAILNPES